MQSQTRNWFLLFLSLIAIFIGYNWYRNWGQLPESAKPTVESISRAFASSIPGANLGDAARFAAAVRYTYKDERDLAFQVLKDQDEEKKKQLAAKPPEPVKPVEPAKPAKPAEITAVGGEGYYLSATLTNRGAGVHELTLTPFKAADWFGRPAKDANGQPQLLQLIPPSDVPSFALYHYADKDDDRPLDTLGKRDWQVVEQKTDIEEQRVVYATELPDFGVRIVKTFTLKPREYHLGLTVHVERLPGAKESKPLRYQLAGAHGLPIEGVWYTTIFRNALFNWVTPEDKDERKLLDSRSLSLTNGSDRFPNNNGPHLQYAAVGIQYFASAIVVAEKQPNFISYVRATNEVSVTAAEIVNRLTDPAISISEKRQLVSTSVPGMSPDVFRLVTDPNLTDLWQAIQDRTRPDIEKAKLVRDALPNIGQESMKVLLEQGLTESERKARLVAEQIKPQLSDITVRVISQEIKADESADHKFVLYHGPVKVGLLRHFDKAPITQELYDRYVGLRLNTLTDYGNFGWWSGIIIQCTNAVHWIIGMLRPICIYDGICIIVVTVLVRLAMMPVSRRQAASMARTQEAMAKIKPEIAKLNERFKNDLVAKQQAQMELYRKHGINPAAGLGGCLMLFVQMPIFLGLYFALQESFFFRLEPFLWMRNLAAPDMLVPWLWNLDWSMSIPFISDPASMGSFLYLGPFFNLLPILSLTLMFIQMKWMQPPAADEQAAQQQKMTQYIMIPMFAFLFYKMPSGLCLYFISSTAWALAERKWLPKKKPTVSDVVSTNGRPGLRGKAKNQPTPPPGKIRSWWDKVLKEASKK